MSHIRLLAILAAIFNLITVISGAPIVFSNAYPFPDSGVFQCTDANADCEIECKNSQCQGSATTYKQIKCHATSDRKCVITITGYAQWLEIHTEASKDVYVTVNYGYGIRYGRIFANSILGGRLFIYTTKLYAFHHGLVFTPLGAGSKIEMECYWKSCYDMQIYDDWTTEVYMQPHDGAYAFQRTVVKNMFDNGHADYPVSRTSYTGLDQSYRASVTLSNCDQRDGSFYYFEYYGNNHGDWNLFSNGKNGFKYAQIYATADSERTSSGEYDIKIVNERDETSTEGNSFRYLKLYTTGNTNTNIKADIIGEYGLYNAEIYAKDAKSLSINAHETGDLSYSIIECPANSAVPAEPNCIIFVAHHPSQAKYLKIYSNNGFCNDVYINCDASTGSCYWTDSKLYRGYDQTTNYATVTNAGALSDYGSGDSPSNSYSSISACTSSLTAYTFDLTMPCNNFPTKKPTPSPTRNPTKSPTANPTKRPTEDPTKHPTEYPTKRPTEDPTKLPTSGPTKYPTKRPTEDPTSGPTEYPTKRPTEYPTSGPTKDPSKSPTHGPTNLPTFATSVMCHTTDVFHFSFVLDESGSVEEINFEQYMKPFTKEIIQRDINAVSDISIILYDVNVITLHDFDDIQLPRDTMIYSLLNRQFDGGQTYTKDAVQRAIDLYDAKNYNENNILFVITDGDHTGDAQDPCHLSSALSSRNIVLVVIEIGVQLDTQCADYTYQIDTWSQTDFDNIIDDIRKITCVSCSDECVNYDTVCNTQSVPVYNMPSYDNNNYVKGVKIGVLLSSLIIGIAVSVIYIFYLFVYRRQYPSKYGKIQLKEIYGVDSDEETCSEQE